MFTPVLSTQRHNFAQTEDLRRSNNFIFFTSLLRVFFFAEKPLRRALAYTFGQLKQILQLAATFPNISISTAVISIEEPPL